MHGGAALGDLINRIGSSDELRGYLREKGENHRYYKYYTCDKKIVDFVLNSHSLYLNKGVNWNDLQDRVNFNQEDSDKYRFGLCTSSAKSENVAMWMLYGKNDGYLIDFSKEIMNECLNSSFIECGKIRNYMFDTDIVLENKDYSIELIDIIYYGETKTDNPNMYYIKRADEVVQECRRDVINRIKYCKKCVPWQYENECRLVVTIDKSIEKMKKCETIKISFDKSNIDKLKQRIYHSPNYSGSLVYESSALAGKMQWSIY